MNSFVIHGSILKHLVLKEANLHKFVFSTTMAPCQVTVTSYDLINTPTCHFLKAVLDFKINLKYNVYYRKPTFKAERKDTIHGKARTFSRDISGNVNVTLSRKFTWSGQKWLLFESK